MSKTKKNINKFNSGLIKTALIVVFLLGLASFSHARMPYVVEIETNYAPYIEIDDKGDPTGFAVEILKSIAKEEGIELHWQYDIWKNSLQSIRRGEIDILPLAAISEDRKEYLDFTRPITISYDSIFVRIGENKIKRLDDIKNANLIVVRDDYIDEYIRGKIPSENIIYVDSTDEGMQILALGKGDAFISAKFTGLLLIRRLGIDSVERLPINVDWYKRIYSIGVKKGNDELLNALNNGLNKIRKNGVYDQLFDKWILSEDEFNANYQEKLDLLYAVLAILFSSLIIGSFFVFLLRSMVIKKSESLLAEISERKKIEEIARVNELKFRGAFDSSMQGMLITALNGQIIHANKSFSSILGYPNIKVIGRSIDSMMNIKSIKEYNEKHYLMKKGILEKYELEIEFKNNADEIVNTKTFTSLVRASDGSPLEIVSQIQDLSELKKSEAEKNRLKRKLQQAEKMEALGSLTGGISHDFNNILASILGFTDLTLCKYEDELNDTVIRYLNEVKNAGERARDLIAQMMDFSRASGGDNEQVDLSTVVKEVLKMLDSTLPSSINIETSVPEDKPFPINIDSVKIYQIVMNLMINARDAMSGKGDIKISVGEFEGKDRDCSSCHSLPEGEYIELSVKDNGSGITPERLKRIFDPFYTTKDIGKGTGMGLSVVHGIVHEYGGHLIVDSVLGEGCEFKILFNPAKNVDHITQPKQQGKEKESRRSARLLVVDDDPVVGQYMKELFEASGHQVALFTDSEKAWQAFSNSPYDFDQLITDQTMPGLLGIELSKRILQERAGFPVTLCTGYIDDHLKEEVNKLNINLFKKPINRQLMLEQIMV